MTVNHGVTGSSPVRGASPSSLLGLFYFYGLLHLHSHSIKSDIYYIGHTDNVDRILSEHNNPQRTKFTFKHLPWELKVSFMVGETRSEAVKAERHIKKKKSRIYIERLLNDINEQKSIAQLVRVPPGRD
ncbi:MAG: GIY-YIG nuclease family protein [Bacteroidetes bacterium]|nr:GIY-YIG nuclease family protein [Bacteroidota bacterium]